LTIGCKGGSYDATVFKSRGSNDIRAVEAQLDTQQPNGLLRLPLARWGEGVGGSGEKKKLERKTS